MRALTWQGTERVSVEDVPDPRIQDPQDAVVRVTSTAICGSDLHLSQCETTQVTEQGSGAALLGYTTLYGQVPGGQAEYLRVPQAHSGPVVVPDDGEPDERYLYLSDVLPTAWQAVEYAQVPEGGSVVVLGLGPIGQMAVRVAAHRGAGLVVGVDLVPERLAMAARHGATVIDQNRTDVVGAVRDLTEGRGPDAVIDAVGMEAHVRHWTDDVLPLVRDPADPLGVLDLWTHRWPLERAPEAYAMFQGKDDGCVKVVLDPAA